MKIGLQIAMFDWPGGAPKIGETLGKTVETADEAGFYSIWTMDHFFQLEPMLGKAEDPMLEAYTALGFMAAHTKKAKLGTMVTGAIYRNPGLLLKAMTTLDVLSGGRTYFGIGAGWYEREAKGLGFKFMTTSERFEMLEEILQLAKQTWGGDYSAFEGKHYKLEEPIIEPQPVSKPHPSILVGGNGEKKTLRMVAQYGDACNIIALEGPEFVKHKLEVLKQHCEDLGRDYSEIEKTILTWAPDYSDADKVLGMIKSYEDVGVEHILFGIPNAHEITPLEDFGKNVIAKL